MEKPSQNDLRLHALSLEIAATYRTFHEELQRNEETCEDLLMAFRCVRRGISVEQSTGKRWGSHSAYVAMQGMIE